MKKIGQGWQYTTYDLENGRVFKKFHSWTKAYFVILRDIFPFDKDSLFEIPSFIKDVKRKADESFEIMKRVNIPQEWMANPRFINKYDFEQDKVSPLHEVFESSNTEEAKKIIDLFIEFNLKLLNLGVIDKGFNITKNYGLDNDGQIVLIDIGELFDNKELINQQLKDRGWTHSYVGGCIQDKEAREYFISEMDRNFKS
ncbi:TPA: hypothetical protein DEP30_03750 [Candidatus Nomurabacteria bacterium]|nr:MAG: hypothetical protein US00_C0004G0012 [Candidatus Nomurabacteria bacterium GW2011_GWF2_36_126]KKP96340.1 MAG: hypothetical protein US04_C0002G0012 [Candidatus Nomurabacteria bacterium GW2011_GWD2_36_14]KKP99001.1 MAG: hypothetical protein US08_C0004G0012 [Candidatus Nomurabacteria bacterium GW2011_GWF2_36_19]KKQ05167.1 MAG: hypothetical protein US17_C0006G0014 [Candidatus Nomurabacteria bacterium GW2011_GWF1_36_47]KKQ09152.1 MAG: hypothetical protein US21_C0007G0011 [Candidatus Nomurabac